METSCHTRQALSKELLQTSKEETIMRKDTESLPQEGFVTLRQILHFIPVSKPTWYKGMKKGLFPHPLKLGRYCYWRVDDIRNLIENFGNLDVA